MAPVEVMGVVVPKFHIFRKISRVLFAQSYLYIMSLLRQFSCISKFVQSYMEKLYLMWRGGTQIPHFPQNLPCAFYISMLVQD